MITQSEAILEEKLIEQLVSLGYEKVLINNESDLKNNFRKQLNEHNKKYLNGKELTDGEFDKVLTHLEGGSVFTKAKKLRDKFCLNRKSGAVWIEFFDSKDWCKNLFQVTNQITMEGRYKNRYDVTILINGLPLVQIELKRKGIELKKAFNQIKRYHKHSYGNLFHYVQIFIVSNGIDTKYFANNLEQTFKHTFYWTDRNNVKTTEIVPFTDEFLEKCHISKMIARYIVLHETNKAIMVLRPYQYHAVESIIKRAVNTSGNGYVWHTTGSGKTLTSFKASQILEKNENIDKVLFVVDRKDLDYQTFREFDSFSKGCVDLTKNTNSFVKQMNGTNKLIITTIQKLTRAIDIERYSKRLDKFRDSKIIFIFDECHRSQFGEMHKKITSFYSNIQMFGFTGTPIFEPNAQDYKTTEDVFGKCLHKYLIKDAINDDNVLGFSVEYIGRYKEKALVDIEVEDIDRKEVLESDMRLEKIADYIIANHNRKTHSREFNSIFAISGIDVLNKYYKIFNSKNHNLKIATIFSFDPNEEEKSNRKHAREFLDDAMKDYNILFGTDYSTDKFQAYYIDISKKVKEKKIDILLVVNMFLTGFDSPFTNTLYIDKNLKYHSLIQAFSRTNRICGEKKSFGNIVSFRNLKEDTDEAIKLYSDADAPTTVLMKSYSEYVDIFNNNLEKLKAVAPDILTISNYKTEEEKASFISHFRTLLQLVTRLSVFTEFNWNDLSIQEQEFENYKSKYLDIYQQNKKDKEKVSILNDIDFEIELLKKDVINATYIVMLLKELDRDSKTYEKDRDFILKKIDSSPELRSKRELIETFIEKNMLYIENKDNIESELDKHFETEKQNAIETFIEKEKLKEDVIQNIIEDYEYSGKIDDDRIRNSFKETYKFLQKKKKTRTVRERIIEIIEKYTFLV